MADARQDGQWWSEEVVAVSAKSALPIGTRLWNNGDMTNPEHWAKIVSVKIIGGTVHYELESELDGHRYWIPAYIISDRFLGHSGTRIVTEESYRAWRTERIKSFVERIKPFGREASDD